jgi:hypothetical protein
VQKVPHLVSTCCCRPLLLQESDQAQSLTQDPWKTAQWERSAGGSQQHQQAGSTGSEQPAGTVSSKTVLHVYPELELMVEPEERESAEEGEAMKR